MSIIFRSFFTAKISHEASKSAADRRTETHRQTHVHEALELHKQGGPEVVTIGWASIAWLLRDRERRDWWQWKEEI